MRFHAIALVLSYLILLFTAAFIGPIVAAILLGEDLGATLLTFGLPAVLGFVLGWGLQVYSREADEELRDREAFAAVGFTWLIISVLAALPYLLRGTLSDPVDGFFEAMSGFTTTGATVITNVEDRAVVPGSILLWRAETQWLGGLGIIVLSIVVLSRILGGGVSLMRAEVSTHQVTRLRPKIAQTASLLWGIYLVFTVVEVLLLLGAGLGPLDAVAYSMSTISSGGFGTRNLSLGDPSFQAVPIIDMIIIVFMVFAGINFNLHYEVFVQRKWRNFVKNPEVRFYLGTMAAASLLLSADLWARGILDGASALRQGALSVISITTTTGFGNGDWTTWPVSSQMIILTLFFVGGCTGSTAGALKAARILIILQAARREVMRAIHPRAVVNVRLGGRAIPEEMVNSVITFFAIYLFLFAAGAVLLTAMEIPLIESVSASASAISNVGPALGSVGPFDTYAHYPAGAKIVMALLMWLGRLEIFAGLVVLFPASYKK